MTNDHKFEQNPNRFGQLRFSFDKNGAYLSFNIYQNSSFLLFCGTFKTTFNFMKKSMFLTIAFLITAISARATEGMWIPSLINMFY